MSEEPVHPLDRLIGLTSYVYELDSPIKPEGPAVIPISSFTVVEGFRTGLRKIVSADGPYTLFLMVKSGVDTLTAVRLVAKHLGLRWESVSYSGLKDARALSYQYITVPGSVPDKFIELRGGAVRLYRVGSARTRLRLSTHDFNAFKVEVKLSAGLCDPSILKENLEVVKSAGLIAGYYGYQRFGVERPCTHLVGKYLLLGNVCGALRHVLRPLYPDEPASAIAERLRGTYSAKSMWLERSLAAAPGWTCRTKVDALGRAIRRLFLSAYQAFLFNKALSRVLAGRGGHSGLTCDLTGRCTVVKLLGRKVEVPLGYLPGGCKAGRTTWDRAVEAALKDECLSEDELGAMKCVRRPLAFPVRVFRSSVELLGSEVRLELGFVLPPGGYATVLLREVIRAPVLALGPPAPEGGADG